jgi:hypothetical protein
MSNTLAPGIHVTLKPVMPVADEMFNPPSCKTIKTRQVYQEIY